MTDNPAVPSLLREPIPQLLTVNEVALLFGVGGKTVTRWADQGRLACIRTLGGHRRFRADQVARLLERP
jgi:excisionase family DNA binding protein